jgi:gluconolactonase
MDLELAAEGLEFPEGPIAMADGSVILTEIKGQRLTRIGPDGGKEVIAQVPGGPNGAAIGPDGAIWICNNGGSFHYIEQDGLTIPGPTLPDHQGGMIQRLDLATGRLETVFEACDGARLIGPNDLVFDREGGFWFTDYGSSPQGSRKLGAVYYAKADGSHISRQREHLISPNGIGLSPDEATVYVADTYLGRLWAFSVTEPGVLAPTEMFGAVPGRAVHNLQGVQLLDSLAVEEGGKVCVATILNGGITIFDPDGGEPEHVPVPDLVTTNICFGGADMRTAWITASSTGRLYRCRWPRPGLKPRWPDPALRQT